MKLNNNKVENPKQQVEETIQLNDCDYLNDILQSEKCMVKDISIALTEASCDYITNIFYDIFDEVLEMQKRAFNLMFKKGWYSLESAEETKIDQKYQELQQKITQLSD